MKNMSQSTESEVAAAHDLIFYVNRNTPKVVPKGASPGKVPDGYGAQTKRRPATEDEEKVIAKGGWLRVNKGGKKPGQAGYKGGSNYRPQLRNKEAAELTDVDFETVEMASIGGYSNQGTVFANVGPWAPEYHKIIKIEWTANGPQSTVVQDYKLEGDLNAVMQDAMAEHAAALGLDLADDDDTPEQQQLLMSAWQALAMYLSSCDDEDKAGAVQALKMVSGLMSGEDNGPTPTGTFGVTTQVAAKAKEGEKPDVKVDKNGKPLPPWMQPKAKKKDSAANTTTWECPMDKRSFGTEQGLINHLQSMHNMGGGKASKMAGAQS